ncbi:type III pantothenate kinase [Arthrospiribacter ruber]|uniref:Type III pantothenate kinase n=1 Tax=Arthrospiribacter ruber TaxID=2487934 RepID=A0A951IWZ5_9BACT|nr:type III pantothenate kinase [Arthrospiribacter ruber]MBW3467672.1 type III pantothenate kinase [Arthrospiribacter ruber]
MNNLIVDIGNSRIKAAVFVRDKLIQEAAFEDLDALSVFSKGLDFSKCIISSVKYTEEQLKERLGFVFLFLDKETPIPINNLYQSPETLGVDRKAAVVGSRAIVKQGALLTIDLGSCITYEILDGEDRYFGGSITPGLKMRFKSMNQYTARLPLVDLEPWKVPALTGNTTETCLQSGVYHGILHEIEGFIHAYQKAYPELKVLICGGDSKVFESLTKDHIFVIPNLVLYGLNRILSYNVNLQ